MFMNAPFYNVVKAELVTAFMPSLGTNDRYIFLDIDEFRSKFGSHVCMSNSSHQSVIVSYNPDGSYVTRDIKYNNPIISGYFAHMFYGNSISSNLVYTENTSYRSSVEFKQPIESLKQLTVRWVDRFNKPVVFSEPLDHMFVLRLYTKKQVFTDAASTVPIPKEVQEIKKKTKPEDVQMLTALITGIFIFLTTTLTGGLA
jgi:hypothetical protein